MAPRSPSGLVPHRPPMLWIDEIVAVDAEQIVCRVTLRDDHAFVENGQAETINAIEWMAQSVAAYVGIEDESKGDGPRPGYLVAIPEARFFTSAVAVGETVTLTCARRFGDQQIASFACVARRGEQVIAEALINVVRPGSST